MSKRNLLSLGAVLVLVFQSFDYYAVLVYLRRFHPAASRKQEDLRIFLNFKIKSYIDMLMYTRNLLALVECLVQVLQSFPNRSRLQQDLTNLSHSFRKCKAKTFRSFKRTSCRLGLFWPQCLSHLIGKLWSVGDVVLQKATIRNRYSFCYLAFWFTR